MLTKFDVFAISKAMRKERRFDERAYKDVFAFGVSAKFGYRNLLMEYCNLTGCDYKAIMASLTKLAVKIKFLQR